MIDHAFAIAHKERHNIFFITHIITWPYHSFNSDPILMYFFIIPHDYNFCLWQVFFQNIHDKLTCLWDQKSRGLVSKKFCKKIRIKVIKVTVWNKNIINFWKRVIIESDSLAPSHKITNTYIWKPTVNKNTNKLVLIIGNFDEAFRMSKGGYKHIRFFKEICYNVHYLWFCFLWLLLVFRRARQAHFILVRFEQHFIRICLQSKIMELLSSESKIQIGLDLSSERVIIFCDFWSFLVVLLMNDMV